MMLHAAFIGNKIADTRKKLNWSQSELAKQISISPQAVGKWERGESMPDIITLNRLAAIFQVDLNYFSENVDSTPLTKPSLDCIEEAVQPKEEVPVKKRLMGLWDMSRGNWTDADFSGLNHLKEKFSSSNIKRCIFKQADLSDLLMEKNNVELCDFTEANLRNTKIQSSNLLNNTYHQTSFIDALLHKSNIEQCDFQGANLSGTAFTEVNLENCNMLQTTWKHTSFKQSNISHIIFEGRMENCFFEQNSFYQVVFQGVTFINTFFKYNDRFKKVQFINCKADKITFAFLKNNEANLTDITLIE